MDDIAVSDRPMQQVIDGSLTLVQDVFRRVRPMLLERAGKSAYSDKQDGSPVTDTDVEIEKLLQAEMAKQFPSVPVFGEETGYDEDNLPDICWLVDPIDGTKSFIAGVPTFTSMAVLIKDGEAMMSIMYNPSTDDMYVATKGGGAYKNDVRIDLSKLPLPKPAFCKEAYIAPLNELLQTAGVTFGIAPTGGGFGFAMVADGLAAARFNMRSRGYVHDYAPGALLVREAGGVIIPILEGVYTYKTRSFVACHPALETAVRAQLPRIRELENK
jgi:fructose-1,6-bisphosphatase/inositol monophosphatase family enzyme